MITTIPPTSPSRLPQSGGIFLAHAQPERLQAIADALHVLTHNAHAFELAAPGSPERAEAGLALDCALVAVKALRNGRAA